MPDFKRFAGKLAGKAAGKARTFASFAASKTKSVSRIAKLNVDIATERDSIKRVYREIGKLYYETHRDDPEGFFVQLCQEIDVSMEAIARMESEIVHLKTQEEEAEAGIVEEFKPKSAAPADEEPQAVPVPEEDRSPSEE